MTIYHLIVDRGGDVRVTRTGSRIVGLAPMAGLVLFGGAVAVFAQAPGDAAPPPPEVPAATAAGSREAQLEERLRRMEEMNQALLRRFEGMAKQNEDLTRTVQDLSKKLEGGNGGPQPASPAPAANGPNGGTPGGGDDNEAPITGGLTSPDTGGRSPKPPKNRFPLTPFADLSYQQRYGFVLQSKDEEFEIRFNGLIQADSRIYQQQHQTPVISDLDIPRARMYFSGRLTKPIEYQVSIQRSTNSLDLLNAYVNFHYDDRLQLRFGRYRAPFTYEWAKLSIWELLTPDRSPFALNFGPNRQVGLMGWGNLLENRLEYAVGIFDGPRNSYQDFNYAKDVMAFLDARPFFETDSVLKTLSVGGSVDAGRENNPLAPALLRPSTSGSVNPLGPATGDSLIAIPFLAFNNNVREKGDRALWELHATYFYKGLSVLGAWDSGHNDMSLTTLGSRPVHLPVSGSFIQAGYLVTGETLEKRALVEPLHPFDLRKGKFGLGALELQARYSTLNVGHQVFSQGLADPNLWTNRLSLVDAGFNWYLNRYVKFYFDWEHAFFPQTVYYRPGGMSKTNDLFWIRLQVYF